MVATESQDVLNRRFVADFASVLGFFNTLLGRRTPRDSSGTVAPDRTTGCDSHLL